jgi:hypothetical protein
MVGETLRRVRWPRLQVRLDMHVSTGAKTA